MKKNSIRYIYFKKTDPVQSKIKTINIIILGFCFLLSLFIIISYLFFREELTAEIIRFGYFGVFLMIFSLESIPQFIHPFFIILMSSGIGMNLFLLILFSLIASFLGGLLAFEVGKKFGYKILHSYTNQKPIKHLILLWEKYGYLFVFIAAISPLPYYPLIFGSLGLKRKRFYLFGIIPRTISYIVFGILLHFGITIFV